MTTEREGKDIATTAGTDVGALVQAVLRESYLEANKDLQFYADKVKHFNQQKKAIRNYLTALRKFKSSVISAARERGIKLCGGDNDDLAKLAALFEQQGHSYEVGDIEHELCIPDRVPPATVNSLELLDNEVSRLEEQLATLGEDSQLANVDVQNLLQRQQQALQMMSNISKMVHDTNLAIIRKIGGYSVLTFSACGNR